MSKRHTKPVYKPGTRLSAHERNLKKRASPSGQRRKLLREPLQSRPVAEAMVAQVIMATAAQIADDSPHEIEIDDPLGFVGAGE